MVHFHKIVPSSLSKYKVVILIVIQLLVKIGKYSRRSVGKTDKYSRRLHLLCCHTIVGVDIFNGVPLLRRNDPYIYII